MPGSTPSINFISIHSLYLFYLCYCLLNPLLFIFNLSLIYYRFYLSSPCTSINCLNSPPVSPCHKMESNYLSTRSPFLLPYIFLRISPFSPSVSILQKLEISVFLPLTNLLLTNFQTIYPRALRYLSPLSFLQKHWLQFVPVNFLVSLAFSEQGSCRCLKIFQLSQHDRGRVFWSEFLRFVDFYWTIFGFPQKECFGKSYRVDHRRQKHLASFRSLCLIWNTTGRFWDWQDRRTFRLSDCRVQWTSLWVC